MKIKKKLRALKEALESPDRRSALAEKASRRKVAIMPDRRRPKRAKNPRNQDSD